MYFSVGFMLIIFSVSVQCYHFLATHQKYEPGKCGQHALEVSKVMKEVKCKPRNTLVELVPEAPNIMLFPQKVEVKRCEGVCSTFLLCYPTEKRDVPVPIMNLDFMSKKKSCGILYVEEHTKCSCGCFTTSEQCTDRQEFITEQCRCVCKASYSKTCIHENMIWNPETCTCECIYQNQHCNNGFEWIPSLCRCAQVL